MPTGASYHIRTEPLSVAPKLSLLLPGVTEGLREHAVVGPHTDAHTRGRLITAITRH